jgi:hypothetical protein
VGELTVGNCNHKVSAETSENMPTNTLQLAYVGVNGTPEYGRLTRLYDYLRLLKQIQMRCFGKHTGNGTIEVKIDRKRGRTDGVSCPAVTGIDLREIEADGLRQPPAAKSGAGEDPTTGSRGD